MNEAVIAAQFALVHRTDNVRQDNFNVRREQAVDIHVEEEPMIGVSRKKNRYRRANQVTGMDAVNRLTTHYVA